MEKRIERTVSYWRIVGAKNGLPIEDLDWDTYLASVSLPSSEPATYPVNGEELSGGSVAVSIPETCRDAFSEECEYSSFDDKPTTSTRALVLAKPKDFIPRQQNATSGEQDVLAPKAGWLPVDNSFLWFLPYGNMFALVTESPASARAGRIVAWLEKFLLDRADSLKSDLIDFKVVPVVDEARAEILESSPPLRKAEIATVVGTHSSRASKVSKLFFGGQDRFSAVRVEVKISLVPGQSTHEDEEEIRNWALATLQNPDGALDSEGVKKGFRKAKVTTAKDPEHELAITEIDLIQQRITRRTAVQLEVGDRASFTAGNVLEGILHAFVQDRTELRKLRLPDEK